MLNAQRPTENLPKEKDEHPNSLQRIRSNASRVVPRASVTRAAPPRATKSASGSSSVDSADDNLSWQARSLQALLGVVILFHAFLLPTRLAFEVVMFADDIAIERMSRRLTYLMLLYPFDVLVLVLLLIPSIARRVRHREAHRKTMQRKLIAGIIASSSMRGESEQAAEAGATSSAGATPLAGATPCALWQATPNPIAEEEATTEDAVPVHVRTSITATPLVHVKHGVRFRERVLQLGDLALEQLRRTVPPVARVMRLTFLLAALLPWDIIPLLARSSDVTWSCVQLLRLLRLWWLPQGLHALSWLLRQKLGASVGVARLVAVTPLYLLIVHVFACAWQLVGVSHGWQGGWHDDDPYLDTVVPPNGRANSTADFYVRALYWSSVVLVTVGFGDIVPTKLDEMLITILAMYCAVLLACTAVALLLNEILFQDSMALVWQNRLDTTAEFVRSSHLPRHVAQRIDEYHAYQWTFLRGVNEASFFGKLPANLRSEALVALNDKLIRKISHFTRASNELIADLAQLLYPLLFLPHEFLHRAGQMASHASLLVRGKVDELPHEAKSLLKKRRSQGRLSCLSTGGPTTSFSEGDCILADASLGPQRVTADLVAQTFVEVHALCYEEVANLLSRRVSQRIGRLTKPEEGKEDTTEDIGTWSARDEARLLERVNRAKQQAQFSAAALRSKMIAAEDSAQRTPSIRARVMPFLRRVSGERRNSGDPGSARCLTRSRSSSGRSKTPLPNSSSQSSVVAPEAVLRPAMIPNERMSASELPSISALVRHKSTLSLNRRKSRWSASLLLADYPKALLALRVAGFIVRLLLTFVLPLRIGFSHHMQGYGWLPVDVMVDLVLSVCLAHRTEHLIADEESSAKDKRRKRVVLAAHLVCLLPMELVAYAVDLSLAPLLMLPRLMLVGKLQRPTHLITRGSGLLVPEWVGAIVSVNVQRMIKMLATTFVVSHWTACMWHGLAADPGLTTSWITEDLILQHNAGWWPAYLRSLHFTLVAVTTIGYGDIVPVTLGETGFTTAVVMMGGLLYPAVVGAIATLLADALRDAAKATADVREFVRRKRMAEPLASQITHFYSVGRRMKRDSDVLGELPSSLRAAVCAQMHLPVVRRVECFASCSDEFLLTLTASLVFELHMPGTNIVQAGDEPSAIFFISKGTAHRLVVGSSQRLLVAEDVMAKTRMRRRSVSGSMSRQNAAESEDDDDAATPYSLGALSTKKRTSNTRASAGARGRMSLGGALGSSSSIDGDDASSTPYACSKIHAGLGKTSKSDPRRKRANSLPACLSGLTCSPCHIIGKEERSTLTQSSACTAMAGSADVMQPLPPPKSKLRASTLRRHSTKTKMDQAGALQRIGLSAVGPRGDDASRQARASAKKSVVGLPELPETPDPLSRNSSRSSLDTRMSDMDVIVLQRLDDGSHFGVDCFLLEVPFTSDVATLKLCECLLLPRAAYTDLMQRFPDNTEDILNAASKLHRRTVRADQAIVKNLAKMKVRKMTGRVVQLSTLPMSMLESERSQSHRPPSSDTSRSDWRMRTSSVTAHRATVVPTLDGAESEGPHAVERDQSCYGTPWGWISAWKAFILSSQVWNLIVILAQLYNINFIIYRASLTPILSMYAAIIIICLDLTADLVLWADLVFARWPFVSAETRLLVFARRPFVSAETRLDRSLKRTRTHDTSSRLLGPIFAAAALIPVDLVVMGAGISSTSNDSRLPLWSANTAARLRLMRLLLSVFVPEELTALENAILLKFRDTSPSQVNLARLLLGLIFVSHVGACVWASIGWAEVTWLLQNPNANVTSTSWLLHETLQSPATTPASTLGNGTVATVISGCSSFEPWQPSDLVLPGKDYEPTVLNGFISWLRGFYFTLATITVVVIGDISPTTLDETIGCMILMLLGVSVNSWIIGSIVGVLANLGEEEYAREQQAVTIRAYLVAYGVPDNLQQRVEDYLSAAGAHSDQQEQRVLDLLPPSLRLEAAKSMRLELISRTKLASLFPPKLLARICLMTKEISIPPGELLMLQGDQGTDMYIVNHGELEVIALPEISISTILTAGDSIRRPHRKGTTPPIVYATLGSGSVLGELSFFLGTKRSATVRAACWSVVLHLERKDVDEMLQERAHLHEQARLHRMVEEMAKEQALANANKGQGLARNSSVRSLKTLAAVSKFKRGLTRRQSRQRSFKLRTLNMMKRNRPVVAMESRVRCTWDAVMLLLFIYIAFSVPFHIGFLSGPWAVSHTDTSWAIFHHRWYIDALIWMDMAFNCVIFEYSELGRVVREPINIVKNYRKHRLLKDIISNLPYELIALAVSNLSKQELLLCMSFLRLPKLIYVRHVSACLHTVVRSVPARLRLSGGAGRIVKALLLLVVVNHVTACIWMLIASWLQANGPSDPSWAKEDQDCNPWAYDRLGHRYLRAVYFSITVLSTVGYGDVRPATALETCFMLVIVVTATSYFAILIGLISSYIRTRDSEAESLKSQLDYIGHYMSYRKMPRRVRQRIRDYFLLVCSHLSVSQASAVQKALPSFLLRDLRIQMQHQRVLAVPALRDISFFPLKELCCKLRALIVLMGDKLCEKGKEANDMYFIDFGVVEVFSKPKPNPRKEKKSDDVDGRTHPGGPKMSITFTRKWGGSSVFQSFRSNRQEASEFFTREQGGFLGESMLHFAARKDTPRYDCTAEAHSHCHLFCLSLNAWRALCALFPEELGPIASRVDSKVKEELPENEVSEAPSPGILGRFSSSRLSSSRRRTGLSLDLSAEKPGSLRRMTSAAGITTTDHSSLRIQKKAWAPFPGAIL
eukprot:CAMPEP_0113284138 /NCGR_PEP_ID=MMETSP0008_2-20120614/29846_1 /TAXON_ID=97485 /ORGANISM="Prymnesium parvum" /LENGTH=2782 /DNA_ID=CAMNT_0000134945 /DNA_START=151 /DNA_END=8500 /DNA_ORIENTATION=+ /assembly_acc=CAM_ASM_000153